MKLWRIRIYQPATEKGSADSLILSMNYADLDDLLTLIDDYRDKIIEKNLKISITLYEVSF